VDAPLLAALVTVPPFAAFLVALLGLRRSPRGSAGVTIGAGVLSVAAAIGLLRGGVVEAPVAARWMAIDGVDLTFGFLLDGPNLLMGAVVAVIALLVQVYSVGYLASDDGRPRYFALQAFFAWSMLSFVYSSNLLQMFLFWELVGLASFFLIGFWYEKPAAAAAGRKAFLMTRVGDVGLFLGLIFLWQETGTLDLARIVEPSVVAALPPGKATAIGLLLFLGVAGKSAQFPLHTWLPDAMEGPTPVSALLHSATMVAAGVFLFARFLPVVLVGDVVPVVVLAVVAFTAILAATIAMVARDIKRILAYSSISQLSFMLLGLAAGSAEAGLFHLFSHAFFKALLFLCAGLYIHRAGSNDVVAIGRAGGRSQRATTAAFLAGGAALAGVPPFAGFFSKETVLHAVTATGRGWLVGATYLAVLLTAYYTFRMIFLVLRPNPSGALVGEDTADAASGAGHATAAPGGAEREGPASMLVPVGVLALFAIGFGFAGPRVLELLRGGGGHGGHAAEIVSLAGALPAVATTAVGILVAWLEYGRGGASQAGFLTRLPALHTLFVRKWYVDEFYGAVVAAATTAAARLLAWFERAILDAGGDGFAALTRALGSRIRRLQTGQLQFYVGSAVLLITLLGWFVGREGGAP
jgi:NADH-quinone oxidoreductase subunit L